MRRKAWFLPDMASLAAVVGTLVCVPAAFWSFRCALDEIWPAEFFRGVVLRTLPPNSSSFEGTVRYVSCLRR